MRLHFYRGSLLLIILFILPGFSDGKTKPKWRKLEQGLYIGVFEASQKSPVGDSRVTVIKIDPGYYDFEIYCASEYGKKLRTTREWAVEFGLTAAINAGMYAIDHLTSVGYLKSGDHLNNPRISKKYNSIFACGALSDKVPSAQIIDLRCQDFASLKKRYHSFTQGIRMISCRQKNVWQQQLRKWSIAALGMDKEGNILFIHCRSPYSVHDFNNIILKLPLKIHTAMYLEGGPEASLYYRAHGEKKELMGSYETGFLPSNGNTVAWQIPNVIGVRRKKKAP